MVYQWRIGYNFKADPEKAAKVMSKLADKGKLNAENLVEVSKPKNAPLHDDFEWDDTKAAENWRKQQGRCMINSLLMIPEETDSEEDKEPIRAFFKVAQVENAQYESTSVLIRTQNGRDALRDQALRELNSYRQKYRTVLDWTGAYGEINKAIDLLQDNKG